MADSNALREADALLNPAGTMLGLARNHAWNDPEHYCASSKSSTRILKKDAKNLREGRIMFLDDYCNIQRFMQLAYRDRSVSVKRASKEATHGGPRQSDVISLERIMRLFSWFVCNYAINDYFCERIMNCNTKYCEDGNVGTHHG